MHIVHLYDGHEQVYEGRGSVPNIVWNLARETVQAGRDVTVVERRWDGLPRSELQEGVRFERIPLRTGANRPWTRVPYEEVTTKLGLARLVVDRVNFAVQAYRRLRNLDADVIHVHLPFAATVLVTAAPWLRDRMVFTAHLGDLRMGLLEDATAPDRSEDDGNSTDAESKVDSGSRPDVPRFLAWFSPDVYLAKRTRFTTVLNPEIEQAFVDRGVDPDRLTVVPNGVDIERFRDVEETTIEHVREAYDLESGPVVLVVGTVMPRKGVVELVEALAEVAEMAAAPPPRVVIAGETELDPDYTRTVNRLIRQHGLEGTISMPGFVPSADLTALYSLADLCVVPSLEEGFGMTAIEAKAAGTPVVATRVGALETIVDHGVDGRLVDPGDVEGLARAITDLLADPSELATMGEQARARSVAYAWPNVAERFLEIYGAVVE